MDISKLTVDPEKLRFQPMLRGKRSALRRQNVIDLINSKPFGTCIKLKEFAAVCACTVPTAQAIVNRLVRQGIVTKTTYSPKAIGYSVNGDVRVLKPASQPPAIVPTPPPVHPQSHVVVYRRTQAACYGVLMERTERQLTGVCRLVRQGGW
jgi:hypothetical protein